LSNLVIAGATGAPFRPSCLVEASLVGVKFDRCEDSVHQRPEPRTSPARNPLFELDDGDRYVGADIGNRIGGAPERQSFDTGATEHVFVMPPPLLEALSILRHDGRIRWFLEELLLANAELLLSLEL
jgi:hypothetical protein